MTWQITSIDGSTSGSWMVTNISGTVSPSEGSWRVTSIDGTVTAGAGTWVVTSIDGTVSDTLPTGAFFRFEGTTLRQLAGFVFTGTALIPLDTIQPESGNDEPTPGPKLGLGLAPLGTSPLGV